MQTGAKLQISSIRTKLDFKDLNLLLKGIKAIAGKACHSDGMIFSNIGESGNGYVAIPNLIKAQAMIPERSVRG